MDWHCPFSRQNASCSHPSPRCRHQTFFYTSRKMFFICYYNRPTFPSSHPHQYTPTDNHRGWAPATCAQIHNSLGSAAMGCVVRRVTRKRDGERFACKTFTLSPDATRKEHEYVLGMLRNETELLRSLDHPNVLRVFEVLETPTSMHIITELCTGGDLGKR
ncbi:unnamed protein product [Phaeothamnion confervicola]